MKHIRLTESDLRGIIKESVKRVITEGTTSTEDCGKWDNLKDTVGADAMIDEMYNFLNADQIKEFIEHMENVCDLYYDEEYQEYFSNY